MEFTRAAHTRAVRAFGSRLLRRLACPERAQPPPWYVWAGRGPGPAAARGPARGAAAAAAGAGRKAAAPGGAGARRAYVCGDCGHDAAQWTGRCPGCGQWNTMKEVALPPAAAAAKAGGGAGARAARRVRGEEDLRAGRGGWVGGPGADRPRPIQLSRVPRASDAAARLQLPGGEGRELGRVLGGGVVPGSVVLVGGEPGIGKSTLMLQLALMMAGVGEPAPPGRERGGDAGARVLYVSGEESVEQLAARAERIRPSRRSMDHLLLLSCSQLDLVLDAVAEERPVAVIVDSIQTLYLQEASGSAGSTTQVRECATALLQVAKQLHTSVFLVGHVTKAGDVAGPRVLEHIVDVVLFLEGERYQKFRLLRGLKNRFGATDELGVFEMEEEGMVAVADPSATFLSLGGDEGSVGARAVAVTIEGSRPLLVELQALSSFVPQGVRPAIRQSTGLHQTRMNMILAVLGKRARTNAWSSDIFVNVAGGLKLGDPGADLAVAVALASALKDQAVKPRTAFVGEIGLGGELRPVVGIQKRLVEAEKMGFRRCICPPLDKPAAFEHMDVVEARSVVEALEAGLSPEPKEGRRRGGEDAAPMEPVADGFP